MLKQIMFLTFVLYSSIAYGQITPTKITMPNDHIGHNHENSTYHCKACDSHLFGGNEVTVLNDKELHYHGAATDDSKIAFNCASCSSHLGHYEVTDSLFRLADNKLNEEYSHYYCPYCQEPIFKKKDLSHSDDSFAYFNAPINEATISYDKREKFYKAEGDSEKAVVRCAVCDFNFGQAEQDNATGGFGVRVDINSVNKKKRKN